MSPPLSSKRRRARNPHEVSVKAETYDRLRAYCRSQGVQMRSVVDDLVNQAIDEAEQRRKDGAS